MEHVKNPNDWTAFQRIMRLRPTDEDFEDRLFDSLTSLERLEVYSMLLLWCGYSFQRKILERRVNVETDSECQLSISVMLQSLR